jgi:osmotically inducible protein OsmC
MNVSQIKDGIRYQKKAEELVESADKICPYSNAIRGNVDVGITVSVR